VIRVAAGVLLAPLAILLLAFLALAFELSSVPIYEVGFADVVRYLWPEIRLAYAGMLVLGLPAHLILQSRGRIRLRDYVIAGAYLAAVLLIGLAGWSAIDGLRNGVTLSSEDDDSMGHLVLASVIVCAAGAIVASVFWFVSVRK
jgi:hypothetical protein